MPGSPDVDTAPVRACVQARLAHEGYKVEVQLTAAV
ncbi:MULTISPECIES: RidA family protein [Aeromonas]|nr:MULTISPECIES: endoribonuclease L-PSP [Aeromonas]AKA19373.1 endoribonuclease L-PSP [Aeromonas hydrophila]KHA55191.1 endoribonuclease L-PSP [Aeromonas hydrophila]KHN60959.1 endoribonuclease L-PSP [Aeromonas hydrophila]MBL0515224.1 endoribonuclease L-PSP [Aeromonas media]MCV3295232.1 endoribonuclease L-PSP [Aeromonas hydrophila]